MSNSGQKGVIGKISTFAGGLLVLLKSFLFRAKLGLFLET